MNVPDMTHRAATTDNAANSTRELASKNQRCASAAVNATTRSAAATES
jgi:hypothetical protein